MQLLDSEAYHTAAKNLELFILSKVIFDGIEDINNSFTKSFVSSVINLKLWVLVKMSNLTFYL
jgi:hypothetical protein